MSDILERICADKRTHIEKQKEQKPLAYLNAKIRGNAFKPRGFITALQNTAQTDTPALIAEIKKASPSRGIIRNDFDPERIAQEYQKGGATCLSILTDEPYFKGNDSYVTQVRALSPLPILRKDFILDPYQVYESLSLGSDCILLIMAALEDKMAQELYELARSFALDVLVEVHNEEELERALMLTPEMIGVNARNLKTLDIDLDAAFQLLHKIPDDIFKVAESGIYKHQDIKRFQKVGARAFLVGESLMRQHDLTDATQNLLKSG